jgi:ferredoxin
MAFVDELAAFGERAQFYPADLYGHINLNTIDAPRAQTLVYCCGPESLLKAVELRCASWPAESLRFERFAAASKLSTDEAGFEVRLARSSVTLRVRETETVLEALENSGVEPASSCRQGLCGACETAVIEGLPDHRDTVLSEDACATSKTMMICVSRARSARLVLDL